MMIGASNRSQSSASGLIRFMRPLVPIIAGKEARGKGRQRRWARGEPQGSCGSGGSARPRTRGRALGTDRNDVRRLATLWPLHHLEADGLTLAQGAIALFLNSGVMYKHIDAATDVA